MQREVAGDASCGDLQSWELDGCAVSNTRSGGDSRAGAKDVSRSTEVTRSTEVPAGWLSDLGRMRQNAAECASPSVASTTSADDTNTSYVSSRTTNSVDGMVSRSSTRSTCSRDSIAPVVKETFGDLVDKLRTVEGRESTFQEWPHATNPRLSPEAMARAGFIFAPDSEAADKVPPASAFPVAPSPRVHSLSLSACLRPGQGFAALASYVRGRALRRSRLAGSKCGNMTWKWLGVQVLCAYCGLELAHWDQVRILKSALHLHVYQSMHWCTEF